MICEIAATPLAARNHGRDSEEEEGVVEDVWWKKRKEEEGGMNARARGVMREMIV